MAPSAAQPPTEGVTTMVYLLPVMIVPLALGWLVYSLLVAEDSF